MLKIKVAKNFFSRLKGLIGKNYLPHGEGLLIAPCQSIHMCFMKFSIDAIFIDKNFVVKKISPNLKTWTGFAICFGAWGVVEVMAGEVARLNLKVGDKLEVNLFE